MQRLYVSPEQFRTARKVADAIKKDRIDCKMNEHDFTNHSSDFLGFLAEFVITDFLGKERPKLIKGGTDGDVDVVIDDVKIDVKASNYTGDNPSLILFKDKVYPCDYFVLLVLKDCFFSVGGISKKDFYEKCYEQDYGYGKRLVVDSFNLENFRFKELKKEVNKQK